MTKTYTPRAEFADVDFTPSTVTATQWARLNVYDQNPQPGARRSVLIHSLFGSWVSSSPQATLTDSPLTWDVNGLPVTWLELGQVVVEVGLTGTRRDLGGGIIQEYNDDLVNGGGIPFVPGMLDSNDVERYYDDAFPSALKEAEWVVQWVKQNAHALGIDPSQVILWGAHAAPEVWTWVALGQNRARANPPVSDPMLGQSTRVAAWVVRALDTWSDAYRKDQAYQASPLIAKVSARFRDLGATPDHDRGADTLADADFDDMAGFSPYYVGWVDDATAAQNAKLPVYLYSADTDVNGLAGPPNALSSYEWTTYRGLTVPAISGLIGFPDPGFMTKGGELWDHFQLFRHLRLMDPGDFHATRSRIGTSSANIAGLLAAVVGGTAPADLLPTAAVNGGALDLVETPEEFVDHAATWLVQTLGVPGAQLPAPDPAGFGVQLCWTEHGGDVEIGSQGLILDPGLATAVLISLGTDARAEPEDDAKGLDVRGFWADSPIDRWGSRLWTLGRSIANDETLERARQHAADALAWLVNDGVAAEVQVATSWDDQTAGLMRVSVVIIRGDAAEFDHLWTGTANADYRGAGIAVAIEFAA